MDQLAVLAMLYARSGREKEVEHFLKSAQPMVLQEPGTTNWFALKLGPAQFAIFDTFPDVSGRDAHLTREVARALFAKAEELFAEPPRIEQGAILASKTVPDSWQF
jgi:quinol monooxygenase YgiN